MPVSRPSVATIPVANSGDDWIPIALRQRAKCAATTAINFLESAEGMQISAQLGVAPVGVGDDGGRVVLVSGGARYWYRAAELAELAGILMGAAMRQAALEPTDEGEAS